MTTAYRSITYATQAIRWTGENYAEVRQFLKDNGIDDDCIGWDGAMDGERIFLFYAWNEDREVHPGCWIAVYTDPRIPGADRGGDIWTDDEFHGRFEPAQS